MPNPLDSLIPAKFRGVPFFIETEVEEGGRKLSINEMPGADIRSVEDLGKLPPIFRVRGFIGVTKADQNWQWQSQQFVNALNTEGAGLLYTSSGSASVRVSEFSKSVDHKRIGEVAFNITFVQVLDNNRLLDDSTYSVEKVSFYTLTLFAKLILSFENSFQIPLEKTTSEAAVYEGKKIALSTLDKLKALVGKVDNIKARVEYISAYIADMIRDVPSYAQSWFADGLLGTIFDDVAASKESLKALKSLLNIGYNLATNYKSILEDELGADDESWDIPLFDETTTYRSLANDNRTTLINCIRLGLFGIYLDHAARIDYQTDIDLKDTVDFIDEAYTNLVLIEGIDPLIALYLDKCRIEALGVLESKLQVVPKIVTMDLKRHTTDIELAYRLYAEDIKSSDDLVEKADLLTDLNHILPTRFLGTVKVLREVV